MNPTLVTEKKSNIIIFLTRDIRSNRRERIVRVSKALPCLCRTTWKPPGPQSPFWPIVFWLARTGCVSGCRSTNWFFWIRSTRPTGPRGLDWLTTSCCCCCRLVLAFPRFLLFCLSFFPLKQLMCPYRCCCCRCCCPTVGRRSARQLRCKPGR